VTKHKIDTVLYKLTIAFEQNTTQTPHGRFFTELGAGQRFSETEAVNSYLPGRSSFAQKAKRSGGNADKQQ